MIIIPSEIVSRQQNALNEGARLRLNLHVYDDGDVFSALSTDTNPNTNRSLVKGIMMADDDVVQDDPSLDYDVLIYIRVNQDGSFEARGRVRDVQGAWQDRVVRIMPIGEDLYSRVKGIYETDALRNKAVLIVGLGSGGAPIAVELAKAGVGKFLLVDHDRIELVNVARHVCGISDVGRFKTKAVRDLILNKNPFASVTTFEWECDWDGLEEVKALMRDVDLVFCCTDNRESRMVINVAAIDARKITIYGGTFRRAYGGQVIRVIPYETICYQCYISTLPHMAEDQEISNHAQAQAIAYTDRPVAIEPGLASDIAPIANLCAKLGILELLRGTETTLASLYDDLDSPVYHWINRREAGTDYEQVLPLDQGEDFRILAWYGIDEERVPDCPVCGNYVSYHSGQADFSIGVDDANAFAP